MLNFRVYNDVALKVLNGALFYLVKLPGRS